MNHARGGFARGARTFAALVGAALLLALAAAPADATFPGVNGKLVAPAGGDLYTFNPDGSDLTNVTNSGGSLNADVPSWSPDGTKIAFAGAGSGPGGGDIYVVNADGTGVTNITNSPDDWESEPAWSPDGSTIAYVTANRFVGFSVFVMNPDGSGRTNLTTGGVGFNFNPDWSPDGARIAFETQRTEDNYANAIWVMNADGSNPTDVTHNLDRAYQHPSWAPDGSKIVFAGICCPDSPLQTINPDGTGQAPLPGTSGGERSPVWSPDGQKVAFVGGYGGLYTINVDGTGLTRIAEVGRADWAPNHPPDCSAVTADSSVLLPANAHFRLVTVSGATDPDGDPVTLAITGVTQDERVTGPGDHTAPDAIAGDTPNQVRLRAERNRRGDGRVYRVAFDVTDSHGATCSGRVNVEVPKRRGVPAIDSAPPSYDSFGS
jgi:Tol biopolymer transport system component